ncbi:membrane protein insertase YidC [candidate division WOR-3 bacterium]|nr:membrane protein insertase YidC [candidate division WOR-3 bacterium]
MSDRTRTTIAFLLIIGVLFMWTILSKPKIKPEAVQPDTLDTTSAITEPVEKTPTIPIIPEHTDTIVVEKKNFRMVLSPAGGSVKEFYLREYDIDVVPDGEYLFVTQINNDEIINFEYLADDDSVVFTYNNKDINLSKVYYFNNPHGFQLTTNFSNITDQILSLKSGISITEFRNKGEDLRHFSVYVKNEKVNEMKKKIKDTFKYTGDVDWFALRSKYFLLVINNLGIIDGINFYKLPKDLPLKTADRKEDRTDIYSAAFGCFYMRGGGDRYGAEIMGPDKINISVLLLPIKHSELATFEKGYEKVASGGIMGPISRIILLVFNFFYSIIRNYGFAIMLFAFLIKSVFFPLSKKMIQSQHKMQMIQPEMKKLQKKYKEDAQRLNQEMMHLYKTYKVNPFGGCLPLLIQMPIFFALYQTLITSIEFRQAPFIFWITDLSFKDPYYILPIAMGVMMLVQSLFTVVDPRQKFMVIIMPVFMVFIFLNFPSGLQLYWFTYNILTLVEHVITKRGGIK